LLKGNLKKTTFLLYTDSRQYQTVWYPELQPVLAPITHSQTEIR